VPKARTAVCENCGAKQPDRFCSKCGEKRVTTHDYSVKHFAEHVVETIAHVDSRALRTLWGLVRTPGLLTQEYLRGRRQRYIGPVQLFVIVNIVFALIGPNTFRTPLAVQTHDVPFPAMKSAMVADVVARRGVEAREFAKAFDATAGLQGKTWVFAMIPGFALCLTVLYGFRRYLFEHLVFATHFFAFTLVLVLVMGFVLESALLAFGLPPTGPSLDEVISFSILAVLGAYLFPALRRVYGDTLVGAGARTLALVVLFYPLVLAYRFLLFFITLRAVP